MADYPLWEDGKEPPISIKDAIEIGKTFLNDAKPELASNQLGKISLMHYPCLDNPKHYFYQLDIKRTDSTGRMILPYRFIILMNGSIKAPVSLKKPISRKKDAGNLRIEIELDGFYANGVKIGNKEQFIKHLKTINPKGYKELFIIKDKKVAGDIHKSLSQYMIEKQFPTPIVWEQ